MWILLRIPCHTKRVEQKELKLSFQQGVLKKDKE
jgi:hypothetical protein